MITETLSDQVDKISKLWDYTAEKTGDGAKATDLLSHMGLDNPHILRTKTLEQCKGLVDKFLKFRSILNR